LFELEDKSIHNGPVFFERRFVGNGGYVPLHPGPTRTTAAS